MDEVIVTLKDGKGAVKIRVSRETAEKLATDNQYASSILGQIRAAEDCQVTPHCSPPVLPTPQPPLTQSHTPQPQVSTTPSDIKTQPAATVTRECHESQKEFQHNTTLLLLELTRTHQTLYNRNKPLFYKKLEETFNTKGYSFTNEKIRKKLGNLLTTYKRAKDRTRATGEGNISWEYYSQMDEIFSGSGVGSASPGTIISTPLFPGNTPLDLSLSTQQQTDNQQPGPSTATKTTQPSGKKKAKSFHDTYESHAERRTAALELLVRPELARWKRLKERRRRLYEKKMITCMGQVLNQLKDIGKQQEEIICLLKESHTNKNVE